MTYEIIEHISIFKRGLQPSIKKGDNVLIVTNSRFPFPSYCASAMAAISELEATPYVFDTGLADNLAPEFIKQTLKGADLCLMMFSAKPGFGWLQSHAHNEVLHSGTRTLMIMEPIGTLSRLLPDEIVINRTIAHAKRLDRAKIIRVFDKRGTDLVFSKEGRKTSSEYSVSDNPGRFDHWPASYPCVAPIENSAEGVLILHPGDVVLGLRKRVETEIRLTIHEGMITKFEGGYDAILLKQYFDVYKNNGAKTTSHFNWGTDHRANWNVIGQDTECLLGTVDLAFGNNILSSPDDWCGLDGLNDCVGHCDTGMLGKSMYLDDELIIDEGVIVPDELK